MLIRDHKRLLHIAMVVAVIASCATAQPPTTTPATRPTTRPATVPTTAPVRGSIESYFSPKDKIAPIVVQLIDDAQHTLDIAAFTFSHRDVAQAIVRAHQRGVKIRFVMDYTQSRLVTCRAIDLIEAGIEVRTRRRRGFQHNKYLIIDGEIVMTGSFNFSASADNLNTENVLVIRDAPEIVAAFAANHDAILANTLHKK